MPIRAACLLCALSLLAVPGRSVHAADTRTVAVHALGAKPTRTQLEGFGADGLRLAGDRTLGFDQLRSLRFLPAPRRATTKKSSWRAWLVGGERVHGMLAGAADDGDSLRFAVPELGTLTISLDALLALEFVPHDAGPCHDLLEANPADADGDVAYDEREDALRGTVLEVTSKHVVLEDRRENQRSMTWTDLRVLRLANDKVAAPKGLWTEVELANGTRLHATQTPQWSGTGAKAALSFKTQSLPGTVLRVPVSQIRALRWTGGAFVRASSLPFTSEVRTPTSDHADVKVTEIINDMMRVRVDRRVQNENRVCPLRVAGVEYRHGFAVHSWTKIKIPLAKQYTSFQSQFGIDDDVFSVRGNATDGPSSRGDVNVAVLGDGKVLWKADSVKGGAKAITIGPLDVSGVEELVLEVGYGPDRLWTLDRADWLEPILVRAK